MIALIEIGYQNYAVPLEALSEALRLFASFRRVSSRHETGVYWYDGDKDRELLVTIVPAERIHASEPNKAPAQPAEQPKPDERLIAAPSAADPIPAALRGSSVCTQQSMNGAPEGLR